MSERISIKPKPKPKKRGGGGACRCHSCKQGCHHDRPNDGWCPRGKAAGYRLLLLLLLWCWGQTQHLSLELSWVRRKRAGPRWGEAQAHSRPGQVGLGFVGVWGIPVVEAAQTVQRRDWSVGLRNTWPRSFPLHLGEMWTRLPRWT